MILSVFITVISGHDKPQPPSCLLELNDNDEKGKVKIENDIEKIDKIIEEIDNKILDLSSETERFKINFQQENRLNDVVQGISRWLKENHLMVEAIKKTDTE